MDAAERQSAQVEPVELPDGWSLIAHYEVPIATILEFRRGGWLGEKFTVMAPSFEEAMRKGCERIRRYGEGCRP